MVDGENPHTVINEDIRSASGADAAFLALRAPPRTGGNRTPPGACTWRAARASSPAGCTAIVVDDGLATGATAKAALAAIKRQGAARTILAVPVAPVAGAGRHGRSHADEIVCLHPATRLHGVGAFYADFHQLTDEETIGLLRQAWAERPADSKLTPIMPSRHPLALR